MQPVRSSVAPRVTAAVSREMLPRSSREQLFREFLKSGVQGPLEAVTMWQKILAVDAGKGIRRWVEGRPERAISIHMINENVRNLSNDDLVTAFTLFVHPELADVSNVFKYQLPALLDCAETLNVEQLCRLLPFLASEDRSISRSVFCKFREVLDRKLDATAPLSPVLRSIQALALRDERDPLIENMLKFALSDLAQTPKMVNSVAAVAKKLGCDEVLATAVEQTSDSWPIDELVSLYATCTLFPRGHLETLILGRSTFPLEQALELLETREIGRALQRRCEQIVLKYLESDGQNSRRFSKALIRMVQITTDTAILDLALQAVLKNKEHFSRCQLIDMLFSQSKQLSATTSSIHEALIAECLRPPLPLTTSEITKMMAFCPASTLPQLGERLVAITPRDVSSLLESLELVIALPSVLVPDTVNELNRLLTGAISESGLSTKFAVLDKLMSSSSVSESLRQQTADVISRRLALCQSLADFENLGLRRQMTAATQTAVLEHSAARLTATQGALCDQLVVWAKLGVLPAQPPLSEIDPIYTVLDTWLNQVGNIPHMISGLMCLNLPDLAPYVHYYILTYLADSATLALTDRLVDAILHFRLFDFDVTAALLSRTSSDSLNPSYAVWWRNLTIHRPDVARAVRLNMTQLFEALENFRY